MGAEAESRGVIHPAARRSVGWIGAPGRLDGHAVLLGPRHAVTCAHVLSMDEPEPAEPVWLRFPNLRLDATARVAVWRPYDPMLSAGSDIAVLALEGEARAPADSWARLHVERPPNDASVATLDFQSARMDGDVRRAEVHDRHGTVISVRGEHLVEPGMSGTALFQCEPGERLLGLVSGKPKAEGQTAGYVIPADEIAPLLSALDPDDVAADPVKLAFETDDERRRFANRRLCCFDLLAPTQTARAGAGVALEAVLSFDRGRADATPCFAEVELHLVVPHAVSRQRGSNEAAEIAGCRVEARGDYRAPYWKIACSDGGALDGRVEIDVPPLGVVAEAAGGDRIAGRMTAFIDGAACPDLDRLDLSVAKQRIIERLRLKDLGDPGEDGDLLLGEVAGTVREVPT